ncbi:sister chromatid cohesion acetyltransferas-like protein Eco1 [Karstenula rhodostoma CBS 690.94]|uniref:Sister chromatid cohesion acetyltransferas-like protein Eco1 n=1 Tax=Karstenula rhodostoma CBS 690.94 TaxID=1392251 RepID=A0A9P4PHB5_9PLEO|nr:sister chromatid cohesion acetyltransferas-like protein Eco1 [Karstenula rhodostoma CBS 690.94]
MSTVRAKKVIRTYSRQRKPSLYEELREPPAKRRRVESTPPDEAVAAENAEDAELVPIPTDSCSARDSSALPSSPKDAPAVFSDDAPRSSPPSSPTPQSSTPPMRKRRPMFSFVKRQPKPQALVKEPLSERSHNTSNTPQPAAKKQKLVQMQLDLVAEPNKTCKLCGMEYVPSLAEDAALHRKFHAMNIGGVDISKTMSERLRQNQVWTGGERSFVAVVSRRDALALRNKAREVLKIVNTELGAVPIPDEALWSSIPLPKLTSERAQAKKKHSEHSASDRYKVYLYVQGSKCVGACLAERIQEAFPVEGDAAAETAGQLSADADANSSSVCVSEARTPAILGISRIWTSNLHRKHGVATTLLNSARSNFLYGMTIGKEEVAFSQPTESGGKLARKWYGREAGWLVYID